MIHAGHRTEEGGRAGDSDLLRRYVEQRSDDAFTELVRRHLDLVYSAALRRTDGDAHRAADVAQSVFTALSHDAAALSRHAVLTGWLYAATRNAALNVLRAERRRRRHEQEAHTMNQILASPEPSADWNQLRPLLDGAMDELGDTDREAVLLRFFEQRSFTDIGAALHVSEDAARMRTERALDKLRAQLAKRGITSTTVALATVLGGQAVASAPGGLALSIAGLVLKGAAAAGAGVATTAALFTFMNATKVALGVAAALAAGVFVYQSSRARAASAELAEAGRNHASLAARLADLEKNAGAAEQRLTARKAELARDAAVKSTASAGSQLSPDAAAVLARGAKFQQVVSGLLEKDAEFVKWSLAKKREEILIDYRPLFRKLGLTPEQREQVGDLLTEQIRKRGEVTAKFTDNGSMRIDERDKEVSAGFLAALRERFGADVAEQFDQFANPKSARVFVTNLSAKMYFLEEPFTAAQTEQLVQLIDNTRLPVSKGTRFDLDRVLLESKPILSPTQFVALNGAVAQIRVDRILENRDQLPTPKK